MPSTNDFSVSYILHHSNRALPGPYKFAALWSGQEGSLLLWAWLLAAYGFVLRVRHKVDVQLTAYASTILSGIQVFFLLLLNFAAPPFSLVAGQIPQDGFGLKPITPISGDGHSPADALPGLRRLQRPFAFALGALMMRYPGEKWIHITRRWTMVTWLFLTCGIFLGAHWAYAVLGWGGYWGMGPGGERLPDAMAHGHCLPAFRHDAGEARHDEDLECLADLLDFHVDDFRGHSSPGPAS